MPILSMPAGSGPKHPTSRVEGRAASLEAEEQEIYRFRIKCQGGSDFEVVDLLHKDSGVRNHHGYYDAGRAQET